MATAPYPLLSTILNFARIRVNDYVIAGGQTLQNTAAFTQDMVNLAWVKMQQDLAVLYGFYRLKGDVVLKGLQPPADADTAVIATLSWDGYSNGVSVDATIALPQDCIKPLSIRERPNNQQPSVANTATFTDTDEILEEIPSYPAQGFVAMWKWQNNQLTFYPPTIIVDLWITYMKFFASFETVGGVNWYDLPVPIVRCEDCFASYIAAEFCSARGDVTAQAVADDARSEAQLLASADTSRSRRITKLDEYGKMRDRFVPGSGPAQPQ
jgi:hypothetical protein